ncbi:carboxypeptidase M32 [Ancylothrix sp. C2]|uniref:carboxypeptidase M32 n=1 Tax=Ancylothrix sp. D3o TaxID=2953691 RepID=UPI0021BA4735|nr:carboxypeptidase M32 [Ancylothrix sp. D3o]MCT7952299.1 carboxypeptidase M32 [Ancylothrix sp. D3o]
MQTSDKSISPATPPALPQYEQLKSLLSEINDIESAVSLLYWDQATYMPAGGATARGRQIATLRQLAHQKFTDSQIGQLLEDLTPYEENLPYDSDEASLIRITKRNYKRAIRIPASFMARVSQHRAASYEAWAQARPANDFSRVQPYLEKTLELSQEMAGFFPESEHIADPLINFSDYGMNASFLREIFSKLRQHLVPLVAEITSQPALENGLLFQHFPLQKQLEFCNKIIARLGYDFQRGRVDKTLHPFTTKFSIGDVRITTRIYENELTQGLFSSIHEAGHAMYEQGINRHYEGTPLAGGISSGVHESQSRLWENIVARSRGFWECFYPQLQGIFLRELGNVSINQFYRAINKVSPSLIRTDADELTYNLHIMIRYDLELEMLEGSLPIRDLPDAWNERYRSDLGITPQNDSEGVLQDVHWYSGYIGGAFQGYTLGNLMAAQFYEAALNQNPEIPVDIERGNFQTLHEWLRENIYQYGRKYTANEIMEKVTGTSLSVEPFLRYIRQKYSPIYNL